MKKKLLLLRHAKSSWDESNLSDYERPLNNRGKQNASTMGNFLKKENLVPDLIISSTAKRADKTANIIAKKSGYDKKIFESKILYGSTTVEDYRSVIHDITINNEHKTV
jgi:phosphohistidine phosphatase